MLSMTEEFSNDQTVVLKGKRTKRHRPASPSCGSTSTSQSTEEEEDMANCLILLAQGGVTNTVPADYVYHCKTCDRTFSSFQALGGHRASHKKPKTVEEKVTATHIPVAIPIMQSSTMDSRNCHSPPLSLHFGSSKPNKLHECSICGSEFTSGQALGGHMRRHRASTTNTSAMEEKRSRNMLELDLNLPAPEDDLRESNFQFNSAKQSIVFSAPALIDCHY